MNNPIYVTKPILPPIQEFVSYLHEIWESNILTNNAALHQRLEQSLCEYFNWKNASLFTNGHIALEIALKSLDLKPGGEIITTPFTFVSTTAAIVNQGFIPVFCDIGDDFTINAAKTESLITENTVAVLPVHVYGFPCDVEKLRDIAEKYNLKIIYDAAHALGVKYKGEDIASYGDVSMFSFHATKLFHTVEGGALVYTDSDMRRDIELNKNFGISGPESVELIGMNGKMNEFQAAMGLSLLKYMDYIIEKRRHIHDRYMQNLKDMERIKLPKISAQVDYNYAYMPALIENHRDKVFKGLAESNIYARKYFYPCISEIDCYKKYLRGNAMPKAVNIAEQIITLPIYPTLELSEVDRICRVICEIFKKGV